MHPTFLLLSFLLWPFISHVPGSLKPVIFKSLIQTDSSKKFIVDDHGAIVRGDVSKKEIALVLTGDEFADGGTSIGETLGKHKIKAAFFLTGNFYSNPVFKKLISDLKKDGHYLGAHSDKHLLYADWTKRDSLLVSEEEFKKDLLANYERMAPYGIKAADALYFLPPYEWYNSQIARWTKQLGLQLINFSPGTRSAADYTYPEMQARYLSSDQIYRSIIDYEEKDPHGLNGFILLIHIGTDPRRTDKFYHKLDDLITELKKRKYRFVAITNLLGVTEIRK
ncbi:MAG: polysaccharide deacetylase family protein [Cyclobacteriaceae bacterium]